MQSAFFYTEETMATSVKKLQEVISLLPEEKKQELLDFAEYLCFREIDRKGITAQVMESLKQVKNRKTKSAREFLNEF